MARHHPRYAEAWDWDKDNEDERAKHGISPREVQEVWEEGPEWVRNKHSGSGTIR